jgi:hypothetical protein
MALMESIKKGGGSNVDVWAMNELREVFNFLKRLFHSFVRRM